MSQTTGLSVDNTAAAGVLSSDAIKAEDIAAGRYDGASLDTWLVNWADVSMRALVFKGFIGEISRHGDVFEAELRGLSERLNQANGRVYQRRCSAGLGDMSCGFDIGQSGFSTEAVVHSVEASRSLHFENLSGFEDGWFEHGRVDILSGPAEGLTGAIKADRVLDGIRTVELWSEIRAPMEVGDQVRLIAGCDKRSETCRTKFMNFQNFRGFPHIPGEDWLMSVPTRSGVNDGGKLKS
ncbi:FAD/FMN-containing dehydrogenase [Rhodovulum sp. P5]|nr:FAD/FMN-containing dehydrogenase [Rhodovulum sp. P5]